MPVWEVAKEWLLSSRENPTRRRKNLRPSTNWFDSANFLRPVLEGEESFLSKSAVVEAKSPRFHRARERGYFDQT
jgi:hypothetical protein